MPNLVARHHNELLELFFKTGRQRIFEKERFLFGLHKEGYSFQIMLVVNNYPFLRDGILYVGMIRPVQTDEQHVLTTTNGIIDSVSKGMAQFLRVYPLFPGHQFMQVQSPHLNQSESNMQGGEEENEQTLLTMLTDNSPSRGEDEKQKEEMEMDDEEEKKENGRRMLRLSSKSQIHDLEQNPDRAQEELNALLKFKTLFVDQKINIQIVAPKLIKLFAKEGHNLKKYKETGGEELDFVIPRGFMKHLILARKNADHLRSDEAVSGSIPSFVNFNNMLNKGTQITEGKIKIYESLMGSSQYLKCAYKKTFKCEIEEMCFFSGRCIYFNFNLIIN
jgi:hypothetical protein